MVDYDAHNYTIVLFSTLARAQVRPRLWPRCVLATVLAPLADWDCLSRSCAWNSDMPRWRPTLLALFDGRGFGASPCLPLLFEPLELCGVSRQLLLSLLFKEILPELAQPYDHVVWQSPDWVRRGAVPIDVCDLFQVHGAED